MPIYPADMKHFVTAALNLVAINVYCTGTEYLNPASLTGLLAIL